MTNFKIIETNHEFPDVLLHRDMDENGAEFVKILAIGIIDDTENMFATEQVECEDYETALSFINYFSVESAEKWCVKHSVSYW